METYTKKDLEKAFNSGFDYAIDTTGTKPDFNEYFKNVQPERLSEEDTKIYKCKCCGKQYAQTKVCYCKE